MNHISEEIKSYFGSASMNKEEFLEHYGKGHLDGGHSGRYPWGSGDEPYQRATDFLFRVESLKKTGWKETPDNIMKEFGLTTKQYRMEKSLCNDERRMALVSNAKELRDKGYNNTDIAKKMGVNESTVREWFDKEKESRMMQTYNLANNLKQIVDEKGMVDVGINTDIELNVSREKLDTALYLLEREYGYHIYPGRIPQPTNPNQMTTQKVLTTPEHKHGDIYDLENVYTLKDYISRDNGETIEKKFNYPSSLDSRRVKVMLKNEVGKDGFTGEDKDGLIEIRRGLDDLSLGKSLYSQVRILVDGNKYLKGMAVYSDDIPDGYDIVFNSNKTKREDAFKKIKDDPDNPFGSTIKDADQGGQYWYTDKKTGEKKLGLINKRADEGDWTEWADSLPSQFLSKQSKQLAKQQLKLAKTYKEDEYENIMKLNNPVIKRHYLDEFAKNCDKAAEDLKAAALPGQKYHVIIPNNTLKDNEVYAPGYTPGTKLALIRYPHGGTFEIPVLTVNNKNKLGQKIIGKLSMDAICVNHNVASQLSGADFDGDTVMCIPTNDSKGKVNITSTKALPELRNFTPDIYKWDKKVKNTDGTITYYREGKKFKPMTEQYKQNQMGVVSNLITDMTLLGADRHEIAKAVKHSMVVIDAVKHEYDYKQSYIDNDIENLKRKYQIKVDKNGNIKTGGASTIISRAGGEIDIPKTRGEPKVNIKGKEWYNPNKPEGSLIYKKANDKDLYYADKIKNKKTGLTEIKTIDGKTIKYDSKNKKEYEKYNPVMKKDKKTGNVIFTNNDGSIIYKTKTRTIKSTQMKETDNAYDLLSYKKHPMEIIYADYANDMKALANKARLSSIATKNLQYDPQAAKVYSKEVSSLNAKLNEALKNSVKERHATRLTNVELAKRKEKDLNMTKDDEKKISQRLLSKYREQLGSVSRRDRNMNITDKEWEAIQAGAISNNKLEKILNNSNPDELRQRSMPKDKPVITNAMINRMKIMKDSNFTLDEISKKLGISKSTVSNYIKD